MSFGHHKLYCCTVPFAGYTLQVFSMQNWTFAATTTTTTNLIDCANVQWRRLEWKDRPALVGLLLRQLGVSLSLIRVLNMLTSPDRLPFPHSYDRGARVAFFKM